MSLQPDAEFQHYLAQGRFMLQRSHSSQRCFFYPRTLEPGTGATDLEWVPASGIGTVYAVTVIRPKPPAEPYNVVLIDLAEGPRMMSRVEISPADSVQIGQRVRARIATEGDQRFVVFDPDNNERQPS
ncbi:MULTISPECIES: Zn-ribbon domain-containing OB-fold protein [unclassified Pseudomonas]|uniref:Zn-ribbon domain-containing OB-fold protein n=1 Tax=unclassified Pseudomonas TaxID=196821 RepID=UPI0025D98A83|nr:MULTISPECIES: OB-fold domain-containing protein [unclassified Pseudomonas]